MKTYAGGCLSGPVRFEAQGRSDRPHSYSCGMCRRHSGATNLMWAEFQKDAVCWTGELGETAGDGVFSAATQIHFMLVCRD